MGGEIPRLFLCYSAEDAEFVIWLSDALRSLGHNIWLDRDDIDGGRQTVDALHDALNTCDVMLMVITPEALQSRLVNSQWTYFYYQREKKLIPLMLRPLNAPDKLNFMLASLQSIDFSRAFGRDDGASERHASLQRLDQALQETYTGILEPSAASPSNSYQTPTIVRDELPSRQAGLLRVHDGMPTVTYLNWVKRARRIVRVLNTWTGVFHNQIELLHAPIEHGCTVQILLLKPASLFARQRSLDLYLGVEGKVLDEDEVPRNIQTSIRQLAAFFHSLGEVEGTLELRLYDVLPSISIHQCDSHTLMGFFPHSTRTTTFPIFEVETDSLLGRRLNDEFAAIWKYAMPVDLSPGVAPRLAVANESLAEPLSERELEVLSLIHAGLSNHEIAERLVVTTATVKKHINNLYSKLGVSSRTRAMLRARQLNLISD